MALIDWNDGYSVGVADIDHEHRELIELINQLYAGLKRDASVDDIADFFGEIHARISAHFALEEKIMREAGYGEYAAHKAHHEELLDDIRDLMDDYTERSGIDEHALSRRLRDWFSEHFRTMDSRLHKALHGGGRY